MPWFIRTVSLLALLVLTGCTTIKGDLDSADWKKVPEDGEKIDPEFWMTVARGLAGKEGSKTIEWLLPGIQNRQYIQLNEDATEAVITKTSLFNLLGLFIDLPWKSSNYRYVKGQEDPVGMNSFTWTPLWVWNKVSGDSKELPKARTWGFPILLSGIDCEIPDLADFSGFTSLWYLGPTGGRVRLPEGGESKFPLKGYAFAPLLLGGFGSFIWIDLSAQLHASKVSSYFESVMQADIHGPLLGTLGYIQLKSINEKNPENSDLVRLVLSGLLWADVAVSHDVQREDFPGAPFVRSSVTVHGPLNGLIGYIRLESTEIGKPEKVNMMRFILGGSLWFDSVDSMNEAGVDATHGPLWGIFGWGRNDGRFKLKFLWLPITF